MCFRKKIKEGYFNKTRHNITPEGNNVTDTRDCDYVPPVYKWYCIYKFKQSTNYEKSVEIVSV